MTQSNWQYSLRGLLVVITAIALITLIATRVGLIEAGGMAIAMILAVVFVRLKGHRKAWMLRPFVAMVAAMILWVVGVDFSEYSIGCRQCGLFWSDQQVRVFGVPLYSRSSPSSQELVGLIAADLGQPCTHQMDRQLVVRVWGFAYACPGRIICLTNGVQVEWYLEPQREQMRRLGSEHPELGPEFHDRVIVKNEYRYYHDFISKFRTEHDPTYQTPPSSSK